MLFDNFERINGSPFELGEPLYGFLNRAAGEYWQSVRDLLTEWLSHYPEEERPTLISRFRRTDRRGFLGAFWELYLHEVFRRLGFEIALHPAVSGSTHRPDFRLQLGTAVTYVEAVTIYESQAHSIDDARLAPVLDAVNNISSRVYPGRGGIIDDHRVIRQRLGEKTRAYGRQLRAPFVIALISFRPTTDFEELLTGLFGAGHEHPEMIRDRAIHRSRLGGSNGFWLTNKGVQYHDASAVLTAFELMPWSVARCQPWLIANPWASQPLEIELPFNRAAVDTTTGNIERVETDFQPPVHFGLASDWPHGIMG